MNFPNFKDSEFKCPCGCGSKTGVDTALLVILQTVRNKYKKPVNITSGIRCQKYNDSLDGSVTNSDHVKGCAADFYIAGVTDTLAKRKEIISYMKDFPNFKYAYCDGYILYANGTSKTYNAKWMGRSIHVSVEK